MCVCVWGQAFHDGSHKYALQIGAHTHTYRYKRAEVLKKEVEGGKKKEKHVKFSFVADIYCAHGTCH